MSTGPGFPSPPSRGAAIPRWLAWTVRLFLLCSVTAAAADKLDASTALATSQAVIGQRVPDVPLTDAAGRTFRFADLRGKPVLVQFIYTGCITVCPVNVRTLKSALDAARDALGSNRFHVVTIGFNLPADTPDAMGSFARQHRISMPEWRFAAVDVPARDALVRAFGFSYAWGAAGFDHIAQVTVVDAEGRIYRQVYGDAFPLPALVEPLRELMTGQRTEGAGLGDWLDRIRILCTTYDPASGRYRLKTGLVFELIGGTLGLAAIAFWYRREFSHARSARRSGR